MSTEYAVYVELPVGAGGNTLDVLKQILAEDLERRVARGPVWPLDPETGYRDFKADQGRTFPEHGFDRGAVVFTVYTHGHQRVSARYRFTPDLTDATPVA